MGVFNKFLKKKIKLVCFDLDNTLYDFGSAEAEAEAYIAEKISNITRKRINPIAVLNKFNQVKRNHLHKDSDPKKFSRRLWFEETIVSLGINNLKPKDLEKTYWDYLVPRIKIFPGTIRTLSTLRDSGIYKVACITDSDGDRKIKLDRLERIGLRKYFDFVITTDDTGENKPSIVNWEHLLKLSGLSARECIMIGDHPDVDLENAKKLGFVTVWTKEHIFTDKHYNYVDYEIRDIGEILKIVHNY